MLAYFYPPVGGAGVQRSAKFAKYLPEFGWEPYVIATTRSIGGEEQDETLLADVRPGAHVWRLPTPRTFVLRDLKRRWPGLEPALHNGSRAARTALRALLLPLSIAESPPADPYFWWSCRIVPLACELILRHRIDVVYTTAPPWSAMLAGRAIKRLTGRPWVADFRDPWTHNDHFSFYDEGWRRNSALDLEAAALRSADRVVTAMPLDDLLEWRDTPRAKATVIYNGYDREDFAAPRSEHFHAAQGAGKGPIRMLYVGTLYPGHYACFAQALAQLPGPVTGEPVLDLVFLGDSGLARKTFGGLDNRAVRLTFRPRVSHPELIAELRAADVLLTMMGSHLPQGKLYEYLASGTPILALVQPGPGTAEIVRQTGTGCAVDYRDEAAIAAAVRLAACDYPAFRARHFRPQREAIEQFERRNLTGQLATVLDECVNAAACGKASRA